MISDEQLVGVAEQLVTVGGVVGVVLGGSRARGTHLPTSDVDLGVYYSGPLDVAGLAGLARELMGPSATVTGMGEWGPWMDGGGWLTVADTPVDWIYRDLQRVRASWVDAQAGRVSFHFQVGHPFGFLSTGYAGELALGVVLADPSGAVTELRQQARHYPDALGQALVDRLWEANFVVQNARKATGRQDTTYVAGCLFRALVICAYALLGHARTWVVNEKGAIRLAGSTAGAPRDFEVRCRKLLGHCGITSAELEATLDAAGKLIQETADACRPAEDRQN